jgi:hypothetical protein
MNKEHAAQASRLGDVTALKLELRAFLEANTGAVWVY